MSEWSRRDFLQFIGQGAVASSAFPLIESLGAGAKRKTLAFSSPFPLHHDQVLLKEGLRYETLISFGDVINRRGEKFGGNNDFTAVVPISKNEIFLWVNHESPEFLGMYPQGRTKPDYLKEMQSVGGSILVLKRKGESWALARNHSLNRRIDGMTAIPFAPRTLIAGKKEGIGTFANCAGGQTPWGSVLTCEENYQHYYGDVTRKGRHKKSEYGWENFKKRSPLHYGWVVEVNLKRGLAKKLIGLGRFCHEGATVTKSRDGRAVVYSGDDAANQCLYKFVSKSKRSLEKGTLYVANLEKSKWIALDWETNPKLKKKFGSQIEVLTFTRKAAKLVGGTPLARPEDIAVDKQNRVFTALTGHKDLDDPYGSILKLEEKNQDAASLEFSSDTFVAGGPKTGFTSPDNLAFDAQGNLWMTTDLGGDKAGKGLYRNFNHNGLFVIPVKGTHAGLPIQVASAPPDAEFTGPSFSPDGQTLFLSVQHPGEHSIGKRTLTSHWPNNKGQLPKSSVIMISGVSKLNFV